MLVVKPITELLCSAIARIFGRERKLEEFANPKSQPSIPKKKAFSYFDNLVLEPVYWVYYFL